MEHLKYVKWREMSITFDSTWKFMCISTKLFAAIIEQRIINMQYLEDTANKNELTQIKSPI